MLTSAVCLYGGCTCSYCLTSVQHFLCCRLQVIFGPMFSGKRWVIRRPNQDRVCLQVYLASVVYIHRLTSCWTKYLPPKLHHPAKSARFIQLTFDICESYAIEPSAWMLCINTYGFDSDFVPYVKHITHWLLPHAYGVVGWNQCLRTTQPLSHNWRYAFYCHVQNVQIGFTDAHRFILVYFSALNWWEECVVSR